MSLKGGSGIASNSHCGFRDCSICLENLHPNHDAAATERKMTFIVPCGHVFHTNCYHTWNKARFMGSQTFQCATCNGPVTASYYVVPDYHCVMCRQSIYQSQHAVTFTIPDHRLVHTECWSLFQVYGKAALIARQQQQQQHRQWRVTKRVATTAVSFRGVPVTSMYRVFLFNSDTDDNNEAKDFTTLLRRLANEIANRSSTKTQKLCALKQLLSMVIVDGSNCNGDDSGSPLTIDNFPAALVASQQSPTRRTVIFVMEGIVNAVAKALQQDGDGVHPDKAVLSLGQESIHEQCCILLSVLCATSVVHCQHIVESGALVDMLFPKPFSSSSFSHEMSLGLQMALTAFVQQPLVCPTPSHQLPIVAAGAIPVILEVMRDRVSDAFAQWVGLIFLTRVVLETDAWTSNSVKWSQILNLRHRSMKQQSRDLRCLLIQHEPMLRHLMKQHGDSLKIVAASNTLLRMLLHDDLPGPLTKSGPDLDDETVCVDES